MSQHSITLPFLSADPVEFHLLRSVSRRARPTQQCPTCPYVLVAILRVQDVGRSPGGRDAWVAPLPSQSIARELDVVQFEIGGDRNWGDPLGDH